MNLTEIKTSIGQSGFTLNQLNEIAIILAEAKEMAAQTSLSVGSEVYIRNRFINVIQKSKKTKGIVEKLNKTRALVKIVAEESWDNGWVRNSVYSIPYSMLESA